MLPGAEIKGQGTTEGMTVFHKACFNGEMKEVERMLGEDKACTRVTDKQGRVGLDFALEAKQFQVITRLLTLEMSTEPLTFDYSKAEECQRKSLYLFGVAQKLLLREKYQQAQQILSFVLGLANPKDKSLQIMCLLHSINISLSDKNQIIGVSAAVGLVGQLQQIKTECKMEESAAKEQRRLFISCASNLVQAKKRLCAMNLLKTALVIISNETLNHYLLFLKLINIKISSSKENTKIQGQEDIVQFVSKLDGIVKTIEKSEFVSLFDALYSTSLQLLEEKFYDEGILILEKTQQYLLGRKELDLFWQVSMDLAIKYAETKSSSKLAALVQSIIEENQVIENNNVAGGYFCFNVYKILRNFPDEAHKIFNFGYRMCDMKNKLSVFLFFLSSLKDKKNQELCLPFLNIMHKQPVVLFELISMIDDATKEKLLPMLLDHNKPYFKYLLLLFNDFETNKQESIIAINCKKELHENLNKIAFYVLNKDNAMSFFGRFKFSPAIEAKETKKSSNEIDRDVIEIIAIKSLIANDPDLALVPQQLLLHHLKLQLPSLRLEKNPSGEMNKLASYLINQFVHYFNNNKSLNSLAMDDKFECAKAKDLAVILFKNMGLAVPTMVVRISIRQQMLLLARGGCIPAIPEMTTCVKVGFENAAKMIKAVTCLVEAVSVNLYNKYKKVLLSSDSYNLIHKLSSIFLRDLYTDKKIEEFLGKIPEKANVYAELKKYYQEGVTKFMKDIAKGGSAYNLFVTKITNLIQTQLAAKKQPQKAKSEMVPFHPCHDKSYTVWKMEGDPNPVKLTFLDDNLPESKTDMTKPTAKANSPFEYKPLKTVEITEKDIVEWLEEFSPSKQAAEQAVLSFTYPHF